MGEMFVWAFIGFVALIFVGMLYDNLRCRHEWEWHEAKVYDKKRGIANVLVLTCKKCGKVKVLK